MTHPKVNHPRVPTASVVPEDDFAVSRIVAIAGSSGSLSVLVQLLRQLPATFPFPIIIAKHISPKYPSSLVEILQRNTVLRVKEAKNGEKLQIQTIYLAPVSYDIAITRDRRVALTEFHLSSQAVCPCANILLHSVALAYGSEAIAIILTGMGSDGTEGIKAICDRQGTIIIQNEATSEFTGMPHAAIAAQVAQYIVPKTEIASTLINLVEQSQPQSPNLFHYSELNMTERDEEQALESLLDYLRRVRGFDFTGYKRPSLKRRILKRMQVHKINSFESYWDYLQVHPEEFPVLFNTILINVTGFFRDSETWVYLQEQVIPDILQQKNSTAPIRVWSAGCASGEESYSVGMLLCEALGVEAFSDRVKIYATDIDEEALSQARQALYTAKAVENIPEDLRAKYLEPAQNNCYTFRNEIRRATIFGCHNLIDDAPISRLDLLVCRNTLMYFDAETQARILARFHFALNDNSALFLGKAEMLLGHSRLFSPISLQHRIFKKVASINPRNRVLNLPPMNNPEMGDEVISLDSQLQLAAFDTAPVAQVTIDSQGRLAKANRQAQINFNISTQQFGTLFQDLELSYRPAELRSPIDQVYRERRSITISDVSRTFTTGHTQYLEIKVSPLLSEQGAILGVSICFLDTTERHQLETELERSNHELETTNEELQSTNEELETTNEELQSSNEELETTNEELQSTNEELETINEELQSSNEELQAINEKSRKRTLELNQTNAFLNSILMSFHSAIVVLDRDLNVLSWNPEAENLWGLRTDEVAGQNFLSLDINLPVRELSDPIRQCLVSQNNIQAIALNAINRRGRSISCNISFNPLIDPKQERCGVILLMDAVELENNEAEN